MQLEDVHLNPQADPAAERDYRETGDPFLAWAEWARIREHGGTPPEWVLKYLDHCALAITAAHEDTLNEGSMKRLGDVLRRALGFAPGRGKTAAHTARALREIARIRGGWVAAERNALARRGERSGVKNAALNVSLSIGVSESQLTRDYRTWRRHVGKLRRDRSRRLDFLNEIRRAGIID